MSGSARSSGRGAGRQANLPADRFVARVIAQDGDFREDERQREALRFAGGDASATLEILLTLNAAHVTGTITDSSGKAAVGARVVLAPERGRHRLDAWRQMTTNERGEYSFDTVLPEDYKLHDWEAIEAESWRDPDVLKKFEKNARVVRVTDLSVQTVNAILIPAEEP